MFNAFEFPQREPFSPAPSGIQFAQVVEQVADLVMITDRAGKIEYVNPAYEKTTGFTKEEVLGKFPSFHKSGLHAPSFYDELWQTILSGRVFKREMVNRKKDGSLYYSLKTITPLLNGPGEITHFVSTDKDVTEQRNLLRKYQDLFGYSADGMAYCDLEGTLLDVNAAFCQLVGYSEAELIGKKVYQNISTAQYWDQGNQILQSLLKQDEPARYEKEYLRKDGKSVPVIVTAFPVKNEAGKIGAIGVVVKDITDRKQHEVELQALNEELRRSNRELEMFAHAAAHDLQAPLRSIACYLMLLEKSIPADKTTAEYLGFASGATKKLQALIRDLLVYARVGAKPNSISTVVDCNAVVHEVLSSLRGPIEESGAAIEVAKLPTIQGDPVQLSLLLQNLLSNAIKYSKESPQIVIEAQLQGDFWLFSVRDKGIGIAEEHIGKLFVMFRRLHADSDIPGTGIGLALCKKVVEVHGGRIWIESKKGAGTTIFFTLPSGKRP